MNLLLLLLLPLLPLTTALGFDWPSWPSWISGRPGSPPYKQYVNVYYPTGDFEKTNAAFYAALPPPTASSSGWGPWHTHHNFSTPTLGPFAGKLFNGTRVFRFRNEYPIREGFWDLVRMPQVLRACWALEMMPDRKEELGGDRCADRVDWGEMQRGWEGREL